NGSFGFMGKTAVLGGATIGTGAPVAATTNDVLNSVSNIPFIMEGGAAFTGKLKEFSLNLNNNLRTQKAIGTMGSVGVGTGRAVVTGKI
ncbi:phage tail tube protein, partial [Staphylococcus aureus]